MAAPTRPIGFWLKLVDRLIEEHFVEVLEEHGVTRRQWQLLNVLAAGESPVERLDAAVEPFLDGSEAGIAADHLTELIESGWVAATPNGYELTDRGATAHERLGAVVDRVRSALTGEVSVDDYATTMRTLEAMARNLGWSGDEAAAE